MSSNVNRYDYCVIGGGPAGSAATARLACHGARVVLVERSDFSRFRIGETIDPGLRALLSQIDIEASVLDDCGAPCNAVGTRWGSSELNMRSSLFSPFGVGWQVNRARFDRLLFDRAAKNGARCIERARCRPLGRRCGVWTIEVESAAGEFVVEAPWGIEATGRSATSRFAPDNRRSFGDQLFAAALLCSSNLSTSGSDGATVIEAAPAGWWYSLTLPQGGALCAFFTDRDLLPRGISALDSFLREQWKFAHSARSLCQTAQRVYRPRFFDARTSVRSTVLTAGWVAVGDAMLSVDPLSGSGVVRAIENALEVCDWLAQTGGEMGTRPPHWSLRQQARLLEYATERSRVYAIERRWPNSPFWRRRQSPTNRYPEEP